MRLSIATAPKENSCGSVAETWLEQREIDCIWPHGLHDFGAETWLSVPFLRLRG